MKVWIYSLLGLLIFCILAFIAQHYISGSARQLNEPLEKAEASVRLQRWSQAASQLRMVNQKWQRTKSTWALLLHHNEIDAIEQSLIKAEEAIRCRDHTASAVELGSLQNFINHVPQKESLNLVNIF